ncbi:MAG: hypothetical protein M4579_001521 [Chaenotheca gracillima]|nr:MAG: hypothetical protein M4579_001521 [Chaenotheca gracillima]
MSTSPSVRRPRHQFEIFEDPPRELRLTSNWDNYVPRVTHQVLKPTTPGKRMNEDKENNMDDDESHSDSDEMGWDTTDMSLDDPNTLYEEEVPLSYYEETLPNQHAEQGSSHLGNYYPFGVPAHALRTPSAEIDPVHEHLPSISVQLPTPDDSAGEDSSNGSAEDSILSEYALSKEEDTSEEFPQRPLPPLPTWEETTLDAGEAALPDTEDLSDDEDYLGSEGVIGSDLLHFLALLVDIFQPEGFEIELRGESVPLRQDFLDVYKPNFVKNPSGTAFGANERRFLDDSDRYTSVECIDVWKTWRGLSLADAEELVFWESIFEYQLTKELSLQLGSVRDSIDFWHLAYHGEEKEVNETRMAVRRCRTDLLKLANDIRIIGEATIAETGWVSSLPENKLDFVLDFLNTRDCFTGPSAQDSSDDDGTAGHFGLSTLILRELPGHHGDKPYKASAELTNHQAYIYLEGLKQRYYEADEVCISPQLVRPCHYMTTTGEMKLRFTLENPVDWLKWDAEAWAFKGYLPIFSGYDDRDSGPGVVHMGNAGRYNDVFTVRLIIKAFVSDTISPSIQYEQTIRTRVSFKVLPWHALFWPSPRGNYPMTVARRRFLPDLGSLRGHEILKNYNLASILKANPVSSSSSSSESPLEDSTEEEETSFSIGEGWLESEEAMAPQNEVYDYANDDWSDSPYEAVLDPKTYVPDARQEENVKPPDIERDVSPPDDADRNSASALERFRSSRKMTVSFILE